jgi:hypothetical protein
MPDYPNRCQHLKINGTEVRIARKRFEGKNG